MRKDANIKVCMKEVRQGLVWGLGTFQGLAELYYTVCARLGIRDRSHAHPRHGARARVIYQPVPHPFAMMDISVNGRHVHVISRFIE